MLKKYNYIVLMTTVYTLLSLISVCLVKVNIFIVMYSILPAICLLVCLLLKKTNANLNIALFIVLVVCGVLFWTSAPLRKYVEIDVFSITVVVFLLLLNIFGASSSSLKPNSVIGIRTFYTLEYPEVWEKTHRFFSVLCTAAYIPLILLIFYLPGTPRWVLAFVIMMAVCITSAVYSRIIGEPLRKKQEIEEQEMRKEQEKKEQGYR